MTFFTITILFRSVRSRLVRLVHPSVRSRGAKIGVGGVGEWKETKPWGTRRADAGEEDNQNLFLLTSFTFFFFFTVSLLSLRRLRHDAFSCLLFLFFYTVGGARRILFCFVWLGWVKKKNWFGFGFRCVVIGLGMMGGEGECLLFDCLCLRYLWYIELEWPTPSFCLFALFCNAVLVVSLW